MSKKRIPARTRRFVPAGVFMLLATAFCILDQFPGKQAKPRLSTPDTELPPASQPSDIGSLSAPSIDDRRGVSAPDPASRRVAGRPETAFSIGPEARAAIVALQEAKRRRTPAQIKLNARLIHAARMLTAPGAAPAPGVGRLRTDLQTDGDGRVLVDLRGIVNADWAARIEEAGGWVVCSSPADDHCRAWMRPARLEQLAELASVREIRPASRGAAGIGSIRSEGDRVLRADITRAYFGASGAGVRVGVLSDSVDFLAASRESGDLGAVTVLPGQAGAGKGEGTAMLEIIHDLAPEAELYFATAIDGPGGFARNIRSLRDAGCDILVDDFEFDDESPFQDDIIARAVNDVTADGAIYVSLAGNSGNLDQATAGTWEGDFVDSNQALPGLTPESGRIHDFGGGRIFNTATEGVGASKVNLFWADPLAGAVSDYDVFVLDPTGNQVRAAGNTTQNGSQDPYESLGSIQPGEHIVLVLFSGAPRFLHLDTFRGGLSIGTNGRIRGHSCAAEAVCTAALDARTVDASEPARDSKVQKFSSDGPRRMFFTPDGEPFTPGNLTASGGVLRQKPDVTATDGVRTTVAEFDPFIGTSAAAPHAAAVAALLMSGNPGANPNSIRSALIDTARDLQATGWDENSGAGLVSAYGAAEHLAAENRLTTLKPGTDTGNTDGQVALRIMLQAAGNENALSFTLEFPPDRLEFLDTVPGAGVPPSVSLLTNTRDAPLGRVGFALALAPGEHMRVGEREMLVARFRPLHVPATDLAFRFADTLLPRQVADVLANPVHSAFEGAVVSFGRQPAPPDIVSFRRLEGGGYRLRALGVPGERYAVEISEDMDLWRPITEILSLGESFEYIDTEAANGGGAPRKRFYRTRTVTP